MGSIIAFVSPTEKAVVSVLKVIVLKFTAPVGARNLLPRGQIYEVFFTQ